MIYTALSSLAIYVFNAFLSFFPSVDSSTLSSINSFYTSVRSTLAGVGWVFPTDTFFQIFGFILIIESSVFVFRVIRWVVNIVTAGFIHA